MKHTGKRMLSLLLALLICVSLLPAALAEAPEDGVTPPSPTQAPETPPLAGEDNDAPDDPDPSDDPDDPVGDDAEPGDDTSSGADAPPSPQGEGEADPDDPVGDDALGVPPDDPDALLIEDEGDLPEGSIANGTCGDNLTWTLDDRGRLVISGTGAMTDYSSESAVPWYSRRDAISYVTINSGATSIGANAFNGLSRVTTVVTCDTLTSIGNKAFYNCSSLTAISIPAGVTTIGASNVGGCGFAFANCSSLTQITVNASNTAFSSADGVLFNKAGTILRVCPGGKSGSYTVPAGVTNIASDAFYKCASLTGITLPESLGTISSEAFLGCTGLSSVIIPPAVTSLGYRAFADCTSITSITFQGDAPSISDNAVFRNVTSMAYYPPLSSWTEDVFQNYGGTLRWSCNNKCGNNVLWVLDDAGVLTIYGSGAMWTFSTSNRPGWYEQRDSIDSVVIQSGVATIGAYAFAECGNIRTISIPEGLTAINNRAFYKCSSLTELTIPASLTAIGTSFTFSYTDSLTAINVHSDNSYYASVDGVLYNKNKTQLIACPGGKSGSVTIPEGVTNIASDAFFQCGKLTGAKLPESLKRINSEAFYASGLTEITLPASVAYLDYRAFGSCASLTSVTFLGNAPTFADNSVFRSVTATAYYPAGDAIWTEDVRQDYGGTITWVGYAPPHTPGDINGDGNVTNKDVTALQRYIKYKDITVNEAALDVNGDGKVTNKDVTALQRWIKYKDVEIH